MLQAPGPAGVNVMQAGPEIEIEIVPGPLIVNVASPGNNSPLQMLELEDEKLDDDEKLSLWLLPELAELAELALDWLLAELGDEPEL